MVGRARVGVGLSNVFKLNWSDCRNSVRLVVADFLHFKDWDATNPFIWKNTTQFHKFTTLSWQVPISQLSFIFILVSLYKWAVVFFHVNGLAGSQTSKRKKSATRNRRELRQSDQFNLKTLLNPTQPWLLPPTIENIHIAFYPAGWHHVKTE